LEQLGADRAADRPRTLIQGPPRRRPSAPCPCPPSPTSSVARRLRRTDVTIAPCGTARSPL